ncbi:ATP-dependent DNA ligase [Methanomicrobium antiquum]|uniref:DNA ligase n=1 Tax=Methanomicrobium antiquum TaxID=487686 RepID=A0AAF0JU16_9EURY|nr:ATP-dependent DNA ligase [Methanomicrobium antiquum]WFN37093.1 ATP-dependent DNA ligase [Methanomicrobium antiquum]
MLFNEFSEICENIEETSGRLDSIDIIAGVLPGLSVEELPVFVRFLMGRIFPDYSPEKIGIGPNLVYEAVAYVVGRNRDAVIKKINSGGDAGRAIENLLAKKEQTSFFSESLDLLEVFRDFHYISGVLGNSSQKEKLKVLKRLFSNANPKEARYISRLILGELRIGVGEGNIRDAIAKAFSVSSNAVEHAYQASNDLGNVAVLAGKGEVALWKVKVELFRPVKMMLAKQGTIADMIAENGHIAAEYKYDGTRFQFHKKGNECRIYSRKLEDVTNAIPDVAEMLINASEHDIILDGEVIAVDGERPLPFQYVLRRFRRKHDIASHVESIKLVPNIFDIISIDNETLIDEPFSKRREILEESIESYVAPQIVSDDIDYIESFYKKALEDGHEGIMVKSLTAHYTPGVRGKEWIKIKPAVDTIDLAVIGAEWGEGKRAKMFGSFLLACQDETGTLLPVSKVATGISDEMLSVLYSLLKDSVILEAKNTVSFEPELVFEVGYAEIQKSPTYKAGYALRFPRFIRLRDDKRIDEIETISSIEERFKNQSS